MFGLFGHFGDFGVISDFRVIVLETKLVSEATLPVLISGFSVVIVAAVGVVLIVV
jgi:hypothetical protein